jgi:hypothetical protein
MNCRKPALPVCPPAFEALEQRLLLAGDVVISEFMADNTHTLADKDGDYSDWIEIHNIGSDPVNLNDWRLTDEKVKPGKWHFPSVNLDAGAYMVVFASGKNLQNPASELHTNFNLKASGEYLALVRPDGTPASEYDPFPAQEPDISYGRAEDTSVMSILGDAAQAAVRIPTDGSLGSAWTAPAYDATGWTYHGPTGIGFEAEIAGFAVQCYRANVSIGSLAVAETVIATPSQQISVLAENAPTVNYMNTGGSGHFA